MATIKPIEGSAIHRIQSGQVIVDLCSAVKELVENSLDAHASSIEIRFKGYGLDSIDVQDNGDGIRPEDHDAIALKHATSKISVFDDIAALGTFGFRGEALSSLSAVSKLSIVTKRAGEQSSACLLDFDVAGRLCGTSVVAAQKGTTVMIGSIFHDLPVRRKDLEKNIKREYGKAIALLYAYACITTHTRFSVTNQTAKGKKALVFSTKLNSSVRENIMNIFGARTMIATVPLSLHLNLRHEYNSNDSTSERVDPSRASDSVIKVDGYVSTPFPGNGRQAPDRQLFFVNSRPCLLPQISKAFNEVYKSFNVSQSPFIVADLRINTKLYDVNVSPDKRTILLHEENILVEHLKTALGDLFRSTSSNLPATPLRSRQQYEIPHVTVASMDVMRSERTYEASSSAEEVTARPSHGFSEAEGGDSSTDQLSKRSVHDDRDQKSNSSTEVDHGIPNVSLVALTQAFSDPNATTDSTTALAKVDFAAEPFPEKIETAKSEHVSTRKRCLNSGNKYKSLSLENKAGAQGSAGRNLEEDAFAQEQASHGMSGQNLLTTDPLIAKPATRSPLVFNGTSGRAYRARGSESSHKTPDLDLPKPGDTFLSNSVSILEVGNILEHPCTYLTAMATASNQKGRSATEIQSVPPVNIDIGAESAEHGLSLIVSKDDFARMRIIGQFNLGFILAVRENLEATNTEELFIIDQHAADEKWNYERLQSTTLLHSQRLVRPKRLDLTAVEQEIVAQRSDALSANGFELQYVEDHGANTIDENLTHREGSRYQLLTLPMSGTKTFDVADLEELIHLLSELPAGSTEIPRPKKVQSMLAMRACRSSLMVGKALTGHQMDAVVRHLGDMDKPWSCPHGRPTLRHLASLGSRMTWNEDATPDFHCLVGWNSDAAT